MNDRFDLRIITQPHSQVYWGYFRRLVFGNSSTKHNKLTYFSNSMLFCSDVLLPFSHIPRCIHAKTPDFPRLFEPRGIMCVKTSNDCINCQQFIILKWVIVTVQNVRRTNQFQTIVTYTCIDTWQIFGPTIEYKHNVINHRTMLKHHG